jgi:DNA (cytosine-5)-methyltransferase 1
VNPEIISMENVPRLQHHDVFKQFEDTLLNAGYKVAWEIVYGPDYGLPQERERLILLASQLSDIKLIDKTHKPSKYKTVRDAIEIMPPLAAGEESEIDRLHACSGLSEKNLKRIRASVPGGTWHDWPEDLRAVCHMRETGKGYVSVYGRMEWGKPSPTITTQFNGFGNGRFGHPEQDRAISLREGALLQTFPLTYEFVDPSSPVHKKTTSRHIGNAVPVTLGQVIAKSIRFHLEQL